MASRALALRRRWMIVPPSIRSSQVTGEREDDVHYDELIAGDGAHNSDALLAKLLVLAEDAGMLPELAGIEC